MLSTAFLPTCLSKAAMKSMNGLIAWWEGLSDENEEKENNRFTLYYPTQFYRGITYTAWARLYPRDSLEREQHSQRAIEYLNQFALSAGGVYAFTAYKLAADVHVLRQEYDEAREFYDYVLGTVKEILTSAQEPLSPFEIERYQGAVMDATLGLLGLDQRINNEEDFQRVLADFEAWLRAQKVPLQDSGYRIRLMQAQRFVDQGRISEALTLAQDVARENQRSSLRLQANAVMAYAIERAPADADISLDVLYQAADGMQQAQEFERASELWRALIARLPGSAKEADYLAQSYYSLAICWHQLGESLLAGKAAEAGCRVGSSDSALLERLAKQWFNKAESLYRSRSSDEVLKQWNQEALDFLNSLGGSGVQDAGWRAAENAFARAKDLGQKVKAADSAEAKAALKAYQEAEKAYEAIQPSSRYFEKAMVQRGVCAYAQIAWDAAAGERAIGIFEGYLKYIQDPAHAPKDATERKFRKENEPSAIYYLGDSWRQLARGGRADAWSQMLTVFDGFPERFQAEQRDLADGVRDARVEALIALGRLADAEKEFNDLVQGGAKDRQVASSAWKLQSAYFSAAEAERANGPAARRPPLRKAADYLGIMNQRVTTPAGDSLYREARMRMELADWPTAEKLLTRALAEAELPLGERYRFGARADLVESLLQQRRVGQAVPLLEELRKESPKDKKVLDFTVKVLAGFLIIEKGQVLEVPGEGQPDSLQKALEAATTLVQLEENDANGKGLNKFMTPSWWEARVDQIYVVWRIGKTDPGQAESARKIIASIESQAPKLGLEICGEDVPLKLRWIQQR